MLLAVQVPAPFEKKAEDAKHPQRPVGGHIGMLHHPSLATYARDCAPTAWRANKPVTGSTESKDEVAESDSRVRNWGTVAAFTLIIALTVAEGVDEGFSLWDWLVITVGAVFILQALLRLNASRSAPT